LAGNSVVQDIQKGNIVESAGGKGRERDEANGGFPCFSSFFHGHHVLQQPTGRAKRALATALVAECSQERV